MLLTDSQSDRRVSGELLVGGTPPLPVRSTVRYAHRLTARAWWDPGANAHVRSRLRDSNPLAAWLVAFAPRTSGRGGTEQNRRFCEGHHARKRVSNEREKPRSGRGGI